MVWFGCRVKWMVSIRPVIISPPHQLSSSFSSARVDKYSLETLFLLFLVHTTKTMRVFTNYCLTVMNFHLNLIYWLLWIMFTSTLYMVYHIVFNILLQYIKRYIVIIWCLHIIFYRYKMCYIKYYIIYPTMNLFYK